MIIRTEQLKVFEESALRQFEDEMMAHSRDFSPRLCEVLGDDQLRVAVRAAMRKADQYGFTNRGPIRLCVELMFLCGSGFDTDPQYREMGRILASDGHQMQRAERMYEWYLAYLERVSGPGAVNVKKALRDLLDFVRMPREVTGDFETAVLDEMHRIFPLKAAYVGEAGLRALIAGARVEARRYEFDTARQAALLVILKFSFGHGCTDDPLYPWISRTLQDERTTNAAGRAERLENKAITWLAHVVAKNEGGAGA